MLLRDFIPAPDLKDFVECYRIVHLFLPNDIPFKAYPPKPEQCLHFFLRDAFAVQKAGCEKKLQPSVLLGGQRTFLFNQYSGRDFIDVQIVFQPSAVFQLTGIPAHELTNQHFDARDIFSITLNDCLEQLQSAKDYQQLILIIENFARKLIQHAKREFIPLDAIGQEMKLDSKNHSMEYWARQSCLSLKQFERKFTDRVGVKPKTYAKIIRFNRAYNVRNRFPEKEWSLIADACGYIDYQHLSKDYKQLTGMTPHQFHQVENKSPESVLGLARPLYHSRFKASLVNL